MKHKKHHHKILIFSFIILAITIGVSFLSKKGYLTESPIKIPLVIPTQVPLWKEFENSKNNFKISYPTSWKLSQWDFFNVTGLTTIPEGSIRFQLAASGNDGKFEVLVWENRSKLPATSWVREFLHEEIDPKNIPQNFNLVFAGKDALQITNFSKARNKNLEYIFFNDKDSVFELIFELDQIERNSEIYGKIKQSFSIIESEAVKEKAQNVENLAIKDLAERKNISKEKIQVTSIKEKQWSDSSLGCPKPGQMYLQVITSGYEITLSVTGANYSYHTDLEKRIILCL